METRCIMLQLLYLTNILLAAMLPATSAQPCKHPHCSQQQQQQQLPPNTVRDLRVALIKQKILEKLRLQAVPVISKPKRPVPQLLLDSMQYDDAGSNRHDYSPFSNDVRDYATGMDEFYAKESQTIIFAEMGGGRCVTKTSQHIACMTFILPQILLKKTIMDAQLNLNIKRGHSIHPLTLRDKHNEQEILPLVKLDDIKEGWLPIDITGTVRRWLGRMSASTHRDTPISFSVQVTCEGCHPSELQKILAVDGESAPFLVVNTDTKAPRRNQRSIDCNSQTPHCCRESLYINFTDIGWDNWIIEPVGYSANYCKGQCTTVLQNTQTFHHTAILASFQESLAKNNKALSDAAGAGLTGCCTPTRMTGLNMLYYDGDGGVHRSILPNMGVETCGCS